MSQKYQILMAAQMYFDDKTVRTTTDELRKLQKYRHMEIMTAKDMPDVGQFSSTYLSNITSSEQQTFAYQHRLRLQSNATIASSGERHRASIVEGTGSVVVPARVRESGKCAKFGCKGNEWHNNLQRCIVNVTVAKGDNGAKITRSVKEYTLKYGSNQLVCPESFYKVRAGAWARAEAGKGGAERGGRVPGPRQGTGRGMRHGWGGVVSEACV